MSDDIKPATTGELVPVYGSDSKENQEKVAGVLNDGIRSAIGTCKLHLDRAMAATEQLVDANGKDSPASMIDAVTAGVNVMKDITSLMFQLKREYCNLNYIPNNASEMQSILASETDRYCKRKNVDRNYIPPVGTGQLPVQKSIADS